MTLIIQIQAFSDSTDRGNGATVVWCGEKQPSEDCCQRLASQLRQSETAFLWLINKAIYIRWFTPICEVNICGHATLAAVLALGQWKQLKAKDSVQLISRGGALPVSWRQENKRLIGQIVLPSAPLQPIGVKSTSLEEQLGCELKRIWSSEIGYFVVLMSEKNQLSELIISPSKLQDPFRRGLVVMQANRNSTLSVDSQVVDYQLRFFAPGLGIDEDPVTGSAHALVANYWMNTLDRDWVIGWQPSQSSGGMRCERAGSGMIRLIGSGCVLWRGELESF